MQGKQRVLVRYKERLLANYTNIKDRQVKGINAADQHLHQKNDPF